MSSANSTKLLTAVIVILLAIRVATLGIPALVDTTEGRYASVAQTMYLSGDWVTPQVPLFEKGSQPYWGKPPLYFWLTATSFSVFGMNEWAARFPCFLSALLAIGLVVLFARRFFGKEAALTSALILASSGLFFFFSAGCITDTTLLAAVAGAVVSIAFCLDDINKGNTSSAKAWGMGTFAFLALGMLTKGPVAIALAGGIIFFWCLLTKNFRQLFKLPWVSGPTFFILIAAPWFILAENRTPGFLRYFFIQENLGRYLSKNYHDLYGSGHVYPYFSSWWMAAAAFAPWTILLAAMFFTKESRSEIWAKKNSALVLCFTWALFPPLFFTFARQLTASYILPAIPGFSLLTGALLLNCEFVRKASVHKFVIAGGALLAIAACAVAISGFYYQPHLENRISACLIAGAALAIFIAIWRMEAPTPLLINFVSTITISLFLAGVLTASDAAENKKSTRQVIDYVRSAESAKNGSPTIGVLYGRPYSAYFYSASDPAHKLTVLPLDPESAISSNAQRIMIRKQDFYQVPTDLAQAFPLEKNIGRWMLLKRK